jgi:hypothetical protein
MLATVEQSQDRRIVGQKPGLGGLRLGTTNDQKPANGPDGGGSASERGKKSSNQ